METADYVDYPTAVALKKCGFDEPCDHYYNGHGNLNRYADTDRINRNTNGHHTPSCSAPTLAHAQKWLREVKGLHIAITWGYSFQWLWFGLHITKFPKGDEFEKGNFGYSTYEQALFAGITASLELIKKGE